MNAMKELERLCYSEDLSLPALREKISQLSPGDVTQATYKKHPFLHAMCMNKNVTIEMVECILDSFPDAASWQSDSYNWAEFYDRGRQYVDESRRTSYPLHLACYNQYCSTAIVKLIMNKYPAALQSFTSTGGVFQSDNFDDVEGLPLHYYLTRKSNVDINTFSLLVDGYPQSMFTTGQQRPFILHVILSNPSVNDIRHILFYIIGSMHNAIRIVDGDGRTPLHLACRNEDMTLEIMQFIYSKWPEAIGMRDNNGFLPFRFLCSCMDGSASLDILRFMLSIDSTVVRERDSDNLPIHLAIVRKSFAFCKVLIDAYPESLKIGVGDSLLPIHLACRIGFRDDQVDTIQYMLELNPESINVQGSRNNSSSAGLPFHEAVVKGKTKVVELILKYDPKAAHKEYIHKRRLSMHLAVCSRKLELKTIKVLFDAYPQAIWVGDEDGETPLDMAIDRDTPIVFDFFRTQLELVQNKTAVLLPLHHALGINACLGTIKLLVKANPVAIRTKDENMAYPLHIACEFSSVKVVQYLVALEGDSSEYILSYSDANKGSILHYACRGGNCEIVKYFLDEHTSLVSSAEANVNGELPLHLLCEAGKDRDECDNAEHIEIIWRMLLANPEVVGGA